MGASVLSGLIDTSGTGTFTLVAAVAAKNILVHAYSLSYDPAAGSGTVQFTSDAAALTGIMRCPGGQNFTAPFSQIGYIRTGTGEALKAVAVTAAIDGWIAYSLE